jgi:hypothetical protein
VTVQGDADDTWQDLQGDFCFTLEFSDAEPWIQCSFSSEVWLLKGLHIV